MFVIFLVLISLFLNSKGTIVIYVTGSDCDIFLEGTPGDKITLIVDGRFNCITIPENLNATVTALIFSTNSMHNRIFLPQGFEKSKVLNSIGNTVYFGNWPIISLEEKNET